MDTDLSDICGHVLVVMAPTGSGKGTIVRKALADHPDIYKTISCTSRDKRPGEVDGEHYYFVTKEEFDNKVSAGEFLEWAEFAGQKYGTLKSEIIPKLTDCRIVLVEIELQGVEQLLKLLPRDHMTIVYVEAGGWDVLKKRVEERAPMSEKDLAARHERYLVEVQSKPLADIVVDNSGDVETAHAEFEVAIQSAYNKCKK